MTNIKIMAVIGSCPELDYPYLDLQQVTLRGNGVPLVRYNDGYCDSTAKGDNNPAEYFDAVYGKHSAGHTAGYTMAVVRGLETAAARGATHLAVFARRYLVTKPWRESTEELLRQSDAITLSGSDSRRGFGFRTDAMILRVAEWLPLIRTLRGYAGMGARPFVEVLFHKMAQQLDKDHPSAVRQEWLKQHPVSAPDGQAGGYVEWTDVLGTYDNPYPDGVLWYQKGSTAADYAAAAKEFGLDYTESDFTLIGDSGTDGSRICRVGEDEKVYQAFYEAGSDKATLHTPYMGVYDAIFERLKEISLERKEPIRILEIGALHGSSLVAMRKLLPDAEIIGADINPGLVHPDLCRDYNFRVLRADCFKPGDLIMQLQGQFDLIIEDSVHTLDVHRLAYMAYRQLLKPHGLLVMEDIQQDGHLYAMAGMEDVYVFDFRAASRRYDSCLAVYAPPASGFDFDSVRYNENHYVVSIMNNTDKETRRALNSLFSPAIFKYGVKLEN